METAHCITHWAPLILDVVGRDTDRSGLAVFSHLPTLFYSILFLLFYSRIKCLLWFVRMLNTFISLKSFK